MLVTAHRQLCPVYCLKTYPPSGSRTAGDDTCNTDETNNFLLIHAAPTQALSVCESLDMLFAAPHGSSFCVVKWSQRADVKPPVLVFSTVTVSSCGQAVTASLVFLLNMLLYVPHFYPTSPCFSYTLSQSHKGMRGRRANKPGVVQRGNSGAGQRCGCVEEGGEMRLNLRLLCACRTKSR